MAEGRGERTIGSGHLVALFLGIVVLCCVFFILGYEMGRAQFEKGGTGVAAKPATPAPSPAATEPPSSGWPSAASSSAAPAKTTTPVSAPAKAPASPAAGSQSAAAGLLKPPDIPKGSIVLQVAANKNESDALNLAKLLQEKGFPAFVLTPSSSTDDWYRVQVGPFADAKAADQAKTALAQEGFKAIAKH